MERNCKQCGTLFLARRADAVYCTAACRQAALRARRGVEVARRPTEEAACRKPPRAEADDDGLETLFRENVWDAIHDLKEAVAELQTRHKRRGAKIADISERMVRIERTQARIVSELREVKQVALALTELATRRG